MVTHHLAQFNVARFLLPMDDPTNVDFVDNLDKINGQAETAPGFVWRAKDESGNSTAMNPYDDPLVIINYSVWESPEALRDYTFSGDHLAIMRRRRDWFEKHVEAYHVCWWIPAGHTPTVPEAVERLDHLVANGASDWAFGMRDDIKAPT